MANYYREFSQVIEDLIQEEHEWLSKQLASEEPEVEIDSDLGCWPGFEAVFKDKGKTLWFHTIESGDVEHVAELVHAFLKRFRPKEVFIMNWADWCSKPRIESFGGGAIVVSSKRIKYINTWEMSDRSAKVMKKELN